MKKTDARTTVTTFQYDDLNRLTNRNYTIAGDTAATSNVTYNWGASASACGTYSKGRLCSVTTDADTSETKYTYGNARGLVTASSQVTAGQTFNFAYDYDRADHLISETYPSGAVIKTGFDGAGRPSSVYKPGTPNTYYAGDSTTPLQYSDHGAIQQMKLGNGLWNETRFNNRLQPTQIGLGSASTSTGSLTVANSNLLLLEFGYGTDNNGNMRTQDIRIGSASLSQAYTYDALNRLESAAENSGWSQTYGYDRYGNRWINPGSNYEGSYYMLTPDSENDYVPGCSSNCNTSTNNRLLSSTPDAAGNTRIDGVGRTFTYDAENRQISFNTGNSTLNATYQYDGDGRRVRQDQGGATKIFVYDAMGRLAAEYSSVAQSASGVNYLTTDHLGSVRVATNATGSVVSRHDYLPFGTEIASAINGRSVIPGYDTNDGIRHRFTGKERDQETGLDYFGVRYMSAAEGRFLSPDPLLLSAKLEDPQTWNRYVYGRNNPLRFTDPEGLFPSPAFNCSETEKACLNDEQRRILNNSSVETDGKKLSGEALFNKLSDQQKNAFVNITDRLASVQLGDGITALSQVGSVSRIDPDRIFANVSGGLATNLQNSKDFTTVSGHAGFNAISFKDTDVTFGNVQFSFNQARTGADIDIDIGNIASMRFSARRNHRRSYAHFW